jgi:hypothetical protein
MFNSKRTTKAQVLASSKKPVHSVKVIANNTFKIEYQDGSVAIRLHDTDVITFVDFDNANDFKYFVLDSGGWRTNTTRDRMHHWMPEGMRIFSTNGLWYVKTDKGVFDYFDGMKISKDGTLLNPNKTVEKEKTAALKMKDRINKFVRLITKDNVPLPENGDCWDCAMVTQDGKSLGDASNSDHLEKHMMEKYLTGSLIVRALKEKGYSDHQIPYVMRARMVDTIRRGLRKYMYKRLVKNIQP